jgi:ribosomal 50S subunit-recycling heat shock protein
VRKADSSSSVPPRLRLDLFLKWSGLIRRRTLAKWMCERGTIRVNEQAAKPGHPVTPGDQIAILRGERRLLIEVLNVPLQATPRPLPSKDEPVLPAWYRVINPES